MIWLALLTVKKIVCYIFIWWCWISADAQQLHFEKKENLLLPSKESYKVYQDSRGYIWIATELGLCKYDGKETYVYDSRNGLPEGSVYWFAEDSKGRLWMVTSRNRILYIENNVIKEAFFSEKYKEGVALYDHSHTMKWRVKDSILVLNSIYGGATIDVTSGKINVWKSSLENKESNIELVDVGTDLLASLPVPYLLAKEINVTIYDSLYNIIHKFKSIPIDSKFQGKLSRAGKIGDNSYIFSYAKYVFQIMGDGRIKKIELSGTVLSIYVGKDGGIWIGVANNGIYFYKNGDISSTPIRTLSEFSVSSIIEDTEENVWATTLEKGIFFCRNKYIVSYRNIEDMDKLHSMLVTVKGNVYFSSTPSRFMKVGGNKIQFYTPAINTREVISDMVSYRGYIYIGGKAATYITDTAFYRIQPLYSRKGKTDIPSILFFMDREKMYNTLMGKIHELNPRYLTYLDNVNFFIRTAMSLENGFILFGGEYLCLYDWHNVKKIESSIDKPITKITNTSRGILVATKGDGLYRYDKERVEKIDGSIPTDVIYDIVEDSYQNIWLATNVGLVKLGTKGSATELYTVSDGLLSNEVSKLAVSALGELFISTPEGLCSFLVTDSMKSRIPPRVYLRGVFSMDKHSVERDSTVLMGLKYNENTLRFTFDVLTYKANDIRMIYTLSGPAGQQERVEENTRELELQNLSPGSYLLSVSFENNNGARSVPVFVAFSIAPPFWQTWWFILGLTIFVGYCIYMIIREAVAKVKERERKKTEVNKLIANSRMEALQSQMNPHFMFNAINSIQNYILNNKDALAYDYLAKFSKLIRLVLESSRKKDWVLGEELEILRLYTELEKLRFENSFSFEENIASDIDEYSIYLPPMLIQPFIENAIWHGIMPLEGRRKGSILLKAYTTEGNLLVIEVEDNGVGRNYKKENSTHTSVAMKLTQERLDLINSLQNDTLAKVLVIDLTDDKGKPSGTKIQIFIPIETDV